MSEPTFIGLDVHARSVAAAALDADTGEVRSCAAPARTAELVKLQGPAVVRALSHEVVGPDVVGMLGPQADTGAIGKPQPAPLRLALGHLEARQMRCTRFWFTLQPAVCSSPVMRS